jgi:tetratricopeptide (TPR) repeat protein
MTRVVSTHLLLFGLLVAGGTAGAQAPVAPATGRLELTTASDAAKRDFRLMLREIFNLRPLRAREYGKAIVASDPNFGLARIQLARAPVSPELTVAARVEEMSRAMATMGSSTAPELFLGLYFREAAAQRPAVALPILRAAATLVPADEDVAYMLLVAERAGRPLADVARAQRDFTARFPAFGPAYNQLAYDLYLMEDMPGALAAAQRQVELQGEHPNAHDTYADILILDRRFDEALAHSGHSLRIDSTYFGGYFKQGAIALAQGRYAPARELFTRATTAIGTPASRVDAHYWTAASYLYQHDVKAALRSLNLAAEEAVAARLPSGAQALPHQRMAVIEALVGDRKNVQAHLAKALELNPGNTVNHAMAVTLSSAALGDGAGAAQGAASYAWATGANAFIGHTMAAVAALAQGNVAAAEAELAQASPVDLLARCVRAEVLKAKGQAVEARALREQVLQAAVKLDGQPGLDFAKLVARLRAEKI